MTKDEYRAIVKKLGLTPRRPHVPNVYTKPDGDPQHVTNPDELVSPEHVRRAAIALILACGRDLSDFDLE